MELPGVQSSAWGPPVRMVADRLGVALDGLRETYEKRTTERRLEAGVAQKAATINGSPSESARYRIATPSQE